MKFVKKKRLRQLMPHSLGDMELNRKNRFEKDTIQRNTTTKRIKKPLIK